MFAKEDVFSNSLLFFPSDLGILINEMIGYDVWIKKIYEIQLLGIVTYLIP